MNVPVWDRCATYPLTGSDDTMKHGGVLYVIRGQIILGNLMDISVQSLLIYKNRT